MFELVYTSISPQGLSESDLLDLLDYSRKYNKENGVTGMLLYHNREFLQILEGEEDEIESLFESIFIDERHSGVRLSYKGDIEERAFADWLMAFKRIDEKTDAALLSSYCEPGESLASVVRNNPNLGKDVFLSLREMILESAN